MGDTSTECDAGTAGADEAGGLEFDPDEELLLEFDEEFELDEEELEDEQEHEEPSGRPGARRRSGM